MKKLMLAFVTIALAVSSGPVQALPITAAEIAGLVWEDEADLLTDHSGGSGFAIYGMSCAIQNGYLYVAVHTNFPEGGLIGSDSYASGNLFDPGDLYINVGGTFQSGGGTVYGVATTNHGNNVAHVYGAWGDPVLAGNLYTPEGGGNPFFATGTWETYEAHIVVVDPHDGDGSMFVNSYPTMIRYGDEVAGDVSGVLYSPNLTDPWAYDIYYKVDLDALSYDGVQDLQLFWAMECGNDGVEIVKEGTVPEPNTFLLLTAAGVFAVAFPSRRS